MPLRPVGGPLCLAPLLALWLPCHQPAPAGRPAPAWRGDRVGSLRHFVPAGYRVLKQKKADLDLDGRLDALLILAPRNEEQRYEARTDVNERLLPRLLLLLTGTAGNQYRLRVRSATATYRYGDDCNFRDSLEGLALGRGWFTLFHYNGQITRIARTTTFRYWPAAANWFLSQDEQTMFYSMHPEEQETRNLLRRRPSLARFNIDDM